MSTHEDGYGHPAGPNPGSQSDFTNKHNLSAPGVETWGNNALKAQESEGNLMAHGAGGPGQPAGGQRPMFGGGSPVFAQMPVYKPVTRGSETAPQQPQPPQPAYNPYAAPLQPAPGLNYSSPQSPPPLAYPSQHPAAAPNYQSSACRGRTQLSARASSPAELSPSPHIAARAELSAGRVRTAELPPCQPAGADAELRRRRACRASGLSGWEL